jgi:poly-gamma-glutamate capsule biosynthesis protein CapA/YwtB (metallophosphatase superfamily)
MSSYRAFSFLLACLNLAGLFLIGCADGGAGEVDETTRFPYVFTPETDLDDYEKTRWETETWDSTDPETGLYVLKAVNHRKGAPEEVLQHFEKMRADIPPLPQSLPQSKDKTVRVSFAGDIMLVDNNWSEYAKPVASLLDGDLRVGNLETPVSKDHSTEKYALGIYSFNAPQEMLDNTPFDLLQLNNNHSLDADDLGLENTVAAVAAVGKKQTGVDTQTMVDVGEMKIAFLAYTWGINDQRRSKNGHELHIIPFGHLDEEIDLQLLEKDAADARKAGADAVVVLLHWGFEYEWYPDPHFMVIARRIVSAGADLVVGQGPHVVQPAEICQVNPTQRDPGIGRCSLQSIDGKKRQAAILYSLGNFGTTQPNIAAQVGLVATVAFDAEQGIVGLGYSAVAAVKEDDTRWLRPLDSLTAEESYAAEAIRLADHLGAWKR